MRIACPSCQAAYNIDDKRVPPGGAKLRCARCQQTFPVRPAAVIPTVGTASLHEATIPLPGLGGAPAPPHPAGPPPPSGAVPLPSFTPASGAGPTLPPLTSASPETGSTPFESMTTGAIPLPRMSTPVPGPMPFSAGPSVAPPARERTLVMKALETNGSPHAVPLPAATGQRFVPQRPAADALEPLPIPEEGPSPAFDTDLPAAGSGGFEDLPAPGPTPRGGEDRIDLRDLPVPAAARELDDVLPPGVSDPLEFDPSAPREDDLELDLSKSLPHSTHPLEDGLEVLSFIEEAARDVQVQRPKVVRFHIRRRSGKVFGPFEEGVIAKMLEEGQLLGNEDVSTDQQSWISLGSVPGFAAVMQRLVAPPSSGVAPGGAPADPAQPAGMEHLQRIYEGRMATVTVVDGEVGQSSHKRLLLLGAAGLLVVLMLGAGASLGLTRYGAFGHRVLFPARVHSGAESASVDKARAGLLTDTFPGARGAKTAAQSVLARREIREARALWVEAVFLLQRRYATADAADLKSASEALPDLALLGVKNPELIKATAAQALAASQPDLALAELSKLPPSDALGALMSVEALLAKAQHKAAAEAAERLTQSSPPSGAAWHALGMARAGAGLAAEAQAAFTEAFKLQPDHFASAVEKGAVALQLQHDAAAALAALAPALAAEKGQLAPVERGRALALEGLALSDQGRADEARKALEEAQDVDRNSPLVRTALARLYAGLHEDAKAAPLFAEVLKSSPGDLVAAQGQVQSLLALGHDAEAANAVAAAVKRFPTDARLMLLEGRVDESTDHLADAEARYKKAIAADPALTDASLALARFYLRFRRIPEAKEQLAALVERLPANASVRVGLGDLAMAEGDTASARAQYEKASAVDPGSAEAWVGQARAAIEGSRYADAREAAEKALALDPHVPDGRLEHGLALWKTSNLEAALAEFDRAKSDGRAGAGVAVMIGAVKAEQGDLAGAETSLTLALKADPGNPEASFWLARVRDKRADSTGAIESMRAALDRAPNRALYHDQMGSIYRNAKKIPEAIEEWKTAIKLDPSDADAHEALGYAYFDAGRFDEAVASFEASLRADPRRGRLLANVGDCFFQVAKWDQAIARYQAALKADPSLTGVYFKIGRAFTEQSAHDRAIAWYQRAIQADPSGAMPYYYLGYAYKERGKRRDAVAAFRQYLAKKPDASDRKEIEDEVLDLGR